MDCFGVARRASVVLMLGIVLGIIVVDTVIAIVKLQDHRKMHHD